MQGDAKAEQQPGKKPNEEVRLPGEGGTEKGCLAAWLGKDTTSTVLPAPRLPELCCPMFSRLEKLNESVTIAKERKRKGRALWKRGKAAAGVPWWILLT